MRAGEINDLSDLEVWLKGRRPEECVHIAFRAAARVAPVVWAWEQHERKTDVTTMVLRRCLISRVASMRATSEIDGAVIAALTPDPEVAPGAKAADAAEAAIAAEAALAAAASASGEAATLAAQVFTPAADSNVAAACADAGLLEAGTSLESWPLWQTQSPLDEQWSSVAEAWGKEGRWWSRSDPDQQTGWRFWRDWYQGLLDGVPPDWSLLEKVALIDPEIWDKGIKDVNRQIARILEAHIPEPLPDQEVLTQKEVVRAALSDFTFRDLMVMLPFGEDLSRVQGAAQIGPFLNDVEDAADALRDLSDYVADHARERGGNQTDPVERIIGKMLAVLSTANDLETLRVRRLIDLGRDLEIEALSGDCRDRLGETLSTMLDDRLDRMREVIGQHFAPALMRTRPLSRLEVSDDLDLAAMAAKLRDNLAQIRTETTDRVIGLHPEDLAALESYYDEVARLVEAADDPQISDRQRRALRQRAGEKEAQFAATLGLYWTRAADAAQKGAGYVDLLLKNVKRVKGVDEFVEWVLKVIKDGGFW